MDQPIVSILMTAYNREKYIAEAIDSVLASDYKNFELIIVDDGSKDATIEIARSYEKKDKRVKFFINEKNLGDYPNRNKAASYANGKYLKYIDADDLIYPWGLRIMVESMERFPEAGYGLCSMPQDSKQIYPLVLSPAAAYSWHYQGKGIFNRAPLSAIIRKTSFEAVGGFSNLRMVGDFEMWHRLSISFPVVLMPQGIVWYRKHSEQEMNHFKKYEFDYKRISLQYINGAKSPMSKEEKEKATRRIRQHASKRLVKYLARFRWKEFSNGKNSLRLSYMTIIKNLF